ncbi:zinc finger and BTB domain-containing protein 41 isoform X2 [Stomoxys calcitrans]|uniref:C2H2-type domain-containing protein n=1 Tax=Stomoxys calcitrans TaxID=35570 RepID=A0A1I8PSD7_STOCA|nr:zinc finger and BTB domain-containing protein 41 isoform X2 [Stomoxys calcitrans]
MSLNNQCRLCVNVCPKGKSLYDNDGQQNELYSVILNYFHPKFLDLCQAKHLKTICEKCWQSIDDFLKFQVSVEEAQLKLLVKNENQQVKEEQQEAQQFEILEVDEDLSHIKVEKQEEAEEEEEEFLGAPYEAELETDQANAELEECSEAEDIVNNATTFHDNSDVEASENFSSDNEMPMTSRKSKIPALCNLESSENLSSLNEMIFKFMEAIKCVECPESFQCYKEYRQHFRLAHFRKEFYFECCKRKFKSQSRVLEHVQFHNNPEAFKCPACARCFATRTSLLRHMSMAHSQYLDQKYPCEHCDKSFTTLKNLNVHRTKKHMMVRKTIFPKPDEEGMLNCVDCSYRTPSQSNYSTHRWYVHNPSNSFVCSICNQGFKVGSMLRSHMEKHENGGIIRDSEHWPHRCDKCFRRFKYEQSLQRHKDAMHPLGATNNDIKTASSLTLPVLYPCNMCFMSFTVYKSLTQHKRRKHPKKKSNDEMTTNEESGLAYMDCAITEESVTSIKEEEKEEENL